MARAWCASDLPCQPRLIVSNAINSSDRKPGSPASSTSMDTGLLNFSCQIKTYFHMLLNIFIGILDPGDAAYDISSQVHGLFH